MRITNKELEFIKTYWQAQFPAAKLYLFGSRADDGQRGGDIDLLILNQERIGTEEKIKFLSGFMNSCGEQKVDIVSYAFNEDIPFKRIALETAVEL